MDSVSQLVLGASIGELVLGRKIGRSSILVGAALGTLPDLDVLAQYADAVASFTYHRSWSHSIFTLSLLSFVLAWLLHRYYPKRWIRPHPDINSANRSVSYGQWLLCVWLILITHPILDGFTVYGTQLLWPLPVSPIAWGSLFIIDPLYTVPLVVAVVIAWRARERAFKAVAIGLALSTGYIAISLVSQQPTPLSILWRVVAMDGEQFHEGFYSIFDRDEDVHFNSYPTQRALISSNYERWPVSRLDWFTQGFISASVQEDRLIINDLRMGVESSYVLIKIPMWSL